MEDYTPLSDDIQVSTENDILIIVNVRSVAKKLSAISVSSAGGPDNIPNWVLKEYADILVYPVAEILNSSFRELQSSKCVEVS